MGTQPPSQKGGGIPLPHFRPISIVAKRLDTSRCHLVWSKTHPRGLCVRWGPSPLPKRGQSPQFSAHVYCDQTAGWMKLILGMVVGLSPGDFVLDGDPVPFPQKGAEPPSQFSAHFYCGHTAACIKRPLGIELGLGPGDFVLDGNPAPRSPKGAQTPNFRPISVAAKWLHGSRCHLVWS